MMTEKKIITKVNFGNIENQDRPEPEPWDEPILLNAVQHPEPIRNYLMPPTIADVVKTVSETVQVPPELPFAVAIAVIATAIGKRAKIQLENNYVEPSPLWTVAVLPKGSRKSGAFSILTKILQEIEDEETIDWQKEWRSWKSQAVLAEAKIQGCKVAAKKPDADFDLLAKELESAQEILDDEPIKPKKYATSITVEALRKDIQQQGSIGLLSSEGSSIFDGFGQYSGNKNADFPLFLAAHDGEADRGSRVNETLGSREAMASMGLTIQPDVLLKLGEDKTADERGLFDRFLFFLPADPRGTRTYRNTVSLDADAMNNWNNAIRYIFSLKQDTDVKIEVDEAAHELWLTFAESIEERQKPDGDLRNSAVGFASKLAGTVGRIALAYHLISGNTVDSLIDETTMEQAIGTGFVLLEHHITARKMMGEDDTTRRASLILKGLIRNNITEIKPSEIQRKGLGNCKNVDDVRNVMRILIQNHYVRFEKVAKEQSGGANTKGIFVVNPACFPEKSEK